MKKVFSSATHGKLLWQKKGLLANPNLAGKGRIYKLTLMIYTTKNGVKINDET